jgi:hypothetical protein
MSKPKPTACRVSLTFTTLFYLNTLVVGFLTREMAFTFTGVAIVLVNFSTVLLAYSFGRIEGSQGKNHE